MLVKECSSKELFFQGNSLRIIGIQKWVFYIGTHFATRKPFGFFFFDAKPPPHYNIDSHNFLATAHHVAHVTKQEHPKAHHLIKS